MAQYGYGTLLKRATVAVATVKSIKGPKVEFEQLETTHLLSTGAFKEYIAGLGDGGEVEAEIYFDKSQMTSLYTSPTTVVAWQVVYPDNSIWAFNGFIKSIENQFENTSPLM